MSDPRPHCLVVNKFLPYPANGGGKLRSWAMLERLLRRASVTLVAYDDGEADRVALEAAGVRLVTRPWPPSRTTLATGLVRSRSLTSARFWDSGLVDDARRAAAAQPPDVV